MVEASEVLKLKGVAGKGAGFEGEGIPERQKDSMAAPVWQAPRYWPSMVLFLELRTRLKGGDWAGYGVSCRGHWAIVVETVNDSARAARVNFMIVMFEV